VPGQGNPGFRRGQTQGECATGKIRPTVVRETTFKWFSPTGFVRKQNGKGRSAHPPTLKEVRQSSRHLHGSAFYRVRAAWTGSRPGTPQPGGTTACTRCHRGVDFQPISRRTHNNDKSNGYRCPDPIGLSCSIP
jgi:hypothetical protein